MTMLGQIVYSGTTLRGSMRHGTVAECRILEAPGPEGRSQMSGTDRQSHWQRVYTTKSETEVSWFEETPELSIELIRRAGFGPQASIVDIGGGASRLVDALLSAGQKIIAVVDLSPAALGIARKRVGAGAARVNWIVADVTKWKPDMVYDVWHDRAAFHFLTDPDDQTAYVKNLETGLRVGGVAIIGTFAPDGPEKCSGLPVARYDAARLADTLGHNFTLEDTHLHQHATPQGSVQRFQFSTFCRVSGPEYVT